MSIFENFEKKLQAEPKSIVFTEGTDARILSAASRLLAGKTLKVILLGEVEAVKRPLLMAALISPVPRSSTPPTTRALTRWSPRWSSCARAR